MKNRPALQSLLIGMLVVLILAASDSSVRAQGPPPTTNWIGTTGAWFDYHNWSGVVPSPLVDAYINNSGQAQILLGGYAKALSLTLGDNQGDSGSVIIADTSSYLEVGDGSTCRGAIYVGNRGSGSLKIANGSHSGGLTSRYGYVGAIANSTKPASNGSVTVEGTNTIWNILDDGPSCLGAGLFVGCTAGSGGAGGTAVVDISSGASITVHNNGLGYGVTVGGSGTLTGNGLLEMASYASPTPAAITAEVYGTVAPGGLFTIDGNLDLRPNSSANTIFHVTPTSNDEVWVSNVTGGGNAYLGGRVTVMLTGTFTPPVSVTLLHAQTSLNLTTFQYESFIYSGGPCISPEIQYDYTWNNVNLVIKSCD